ncbi:hypothetical protein D3C71_1516200 [compost metagenome]
MPTPYSPAAGNVTPNEPSGAVPARAISSRYSASGIWIRMPAPSPMSLSAPTAPRWSMFSRILSACVTMSWRFTPLMWATKPSPQASCSLPEEYKPFCCRCSISAAVVMAHSSCFRREGKISALQHDLASRLIGVRSKLTNGYCHTQINRGHIKINSYQRFINKCQRPISLRFLSRHRPTRLPAGDAALRGFL